MPKWHGSVQVSDWLRRIHEEDRGRPPQELGVYVVSVNKWTRRPTCGCHPLYVGGQISARGSLRRRMGQWICDSFGLFIEDECGEAMQGYHCGAQSLFLWCTREKKSLLDLYIGWT